MTPQREEAERYLRLARRDEAAFLALLNSPTVDFSVACFHAQQSVEKSLKAVMFLHGLEFRRTHDLEELSGTLADAGINTPLEATELRRLTPYAVEFRYDDEPMPLVSPEGGCLQCTGPVWIDKALGIVLQSGSCLNIPT